MKATLITAMIFISTMLTAQVKQGTYECSLGDQYGYMMDHHDTDVKIVEKVMDDFIKQYGKVKRNRKAKEWYCEECKMSKITSAPVTVYYKVEEGKNLVTTYMFVDDGEKFISSYNDQDGAKEIENLNIDIYLEIQREVMREAIKDMEDKLKDHEKDLSKLEKKNEDLHSDIDDYKDKIVKAEKDIEQNLQDQEDKRIEIEQQKKIIAKSTEKLNQIGRN